MPGSTQAFVDSPIYARTSGYLKRWYLDIGARVKQPTCWRRSTLPKSTSNCGRRAPISIRRSQSDLAQTTADRWQFLLKSGSVSKQETDQAVSDLHAKKAAVESNSANVHRLEDLQSFEKVYAPVRWRDYRAQHRYRRSDRRGRGTAEPQELFHLAAIAQVCAFLSPCRKSIRAPRRTRRHRNVDAGRIRRTTIHREAGAQCQFHRSGVANPAGGGRRRQPHRSSAARSLCYRCISSCRRDPFGYGSIQRPAVPCGRLAGRGGPERRGGTHCRSPSAAISAARWKWCPGLKQSESVILNPSDSLLSGTPVRVNAPKKAS